MALQPFSVAVVVGSNDPLVEATNYKIGAEVYVKLTSAGNPLADVYLDEAGANPITQPLISNSRGLVEFFANAGQYLLEYNDGQQLLSTRIGVGATEHSALTNLNAVGGHDSIYRRAATVAQIEDGDFAVGSRLTVTDRGDAPFNVVAGGTPNGFDILDAGNGNVAVWQPSAHVSAAEIGMSASLTTNDATMKALVERLKVDGISSVTFDSGVHNFQCFEDLAIGRAAVEFRDVSNVKFIGGVATTFKAVTGGFGTDPFSLIRIDKDTKNVEFKGIEFDGDYSNVPEFAGQTANVSSGVIIANWDFSKVASTQDSYEDFSIENIVFDGCTFKNIGGGVTTRRKSANTARGGYTSVSVKDCTFEDAQQSNNSIGADYGYKWLITRNNFYTTIPLSDTVWTIAVDMSRGGIANEISYNRIDKYHYGMKFEYNLTGGVSGTDIENSEVSSMHNNNLTDIGHPTLDNGPGTSSSGSYGIRMSGNNLAEYDNQIAGLFNAANVGAERRLVQGVWSNHANIDGTYHTSDRGSVGGAQLAVNHNSDNSNNGYVCQFKKIRDCDKGIILQAGGKALHNDIRRIQDSAISMQIQDETFANNNNIVDVDKASTGNGAIKGDPSSGATLKYWEVLDNKIDTVDGGAGTGVVMNGAFASAFFSFRYRAGVMTNVATLENQELVSDVLAGDSVKMRLTANPSTRTIIDSQNVKRLNAVDANTFEIEFLKPLPSALFQFSAIEPNQAGTINWINFGTTANTLRLRSVNNSGVPVALPASVMVSVF